VKSWFHGECGDKHGIIDEADYMWFPNSRINFIDPKTGKVIKG